MILRHALIDYKPPPIGTFIVGGKLDVTEKGAAAAVKCFERSMDAAVLFESALDSMSVARAHTRVGAPFSALRELELHSDRMSGASSIDLFFLLMCVLRLNVRWPSHLLARSN